MISHVYVSSKRNLMMSSYSHVRMGMGMMTAGIFLHSYLWYSYRPRVFMDIDKY